MLGVASSKPRPLYLTAKALAAQKGSRELLCALSLPQGLAKTPRPQDRPAGSSPSTGQCQRIVLLAFLKNGIKMEQQLGLKCLIALSPHKITQAS